MTITEPSLADRAKLETTRGLCDVRRSYGVGDVEVRAATTENPNIINFYGHASTWQPYEMYGGPSNGGWTETVERGAFNRTLKAKADVPFLINHQGMSLARTKAGTLLLEPDDIGLAVQASLDTRNSVVNDLSIEMERKSVDEMSFAFRVRGQTWFDAEGEEVPWWDLSGIDRHLSELDLHKGDVSVVNFGANDTTDAALRSLSDLRGLSLENCEPGELREAIAYLESLLPAPEPAAVHPDLIALQHQVIANGARLRAVSL